MIPRIIIIFGSFLALTGSAAAQPAPRVDRAGAQVMRYRFATVNENAWCDPRQNAEVGAEIDRIVAAGFNGLSIGTYKFMPIYFVDYAKTKYPEAQEYSATKVAQNVATLRQNIRRAKAKGVQYFVSRSYAHYAPYQFWKAHQPELNPDGLFTPLLEKAHQNDIYLKTLAGEDNIIPQQQWTNLVFRQFFLESTALMLDALPELDGFLNAYAEAAWTYDQAKLKANTWTNWKDVVDYPATDTQFVDYANALYRLLQEKRGDRLFFGLRDWYVSPEVLRRLTMPRGQLVISVKYAGYDQPLVNYPPWGKTLLDEGYSVILDMLVFDAEHPHPLYWYDSDIVFPIFDHIYAAGFSGVMYQDFTTKGGDSPNNPIRLLTQKTVGAAMQRRAFGDRDAVEFLRPYYGDGAADLLTSLKDVSVAQAEMIKLCPAWFWQGDGLTPGGLQTLRFWMLMDNPDAPPGMEFVRQDVVGVNEYVAAALAGDAVLARTETEWKRTGKKTPLDVIALMRTRADDAVAAMVRARRNAPANAPYLQDIVASAVIHQQLVLRDEAFIRAALAFYESGGRYDGKYDMTTALQPAGRNEKQLCLAQLQELVRRDIVLRELCLHYAPRRPQTRSKNDYAFEKKIASLLGATLAMPVMDTAALNAAKTTILDSRGD